MILDRLRGLYLFEFKQWSYDYLSLSTIQEASYEEPSENTLSFETLTTFKVE